MRVLANRWWRGLLGVLFLAVAAPWMLAAQEDASETEPVAPAAADDESTPETPADADSAESDPADEPAEPSGSDEPAEPADEPGEPADEPAEADPADTPAPADEPSEEPGETPDESAPAEEPAESPAGDEPEDPAEMTEEPGEFEEDPADQPAVPTPLRGRKPGKKPAKLPAVMPAEPAEPAAEPAPPTPAPAPTVPDTPPEAPPAPRKAPVRQPAVRMTPAPEPAAELPAPERRPVEGELSAELAAAVQDDPALHGAWVDVAQTAEGEYVLTAIVDESRSQAQSERLQNIIRKYLKLHQYDFTYHRWPFGKVLSAVQQAVETTEGLDSCLVEDAFFSRDGADLRLNLLGRVAAEIQSVRVNEVATAVVTQWAPANYDGTLQTDTAALIVVAPSPGVAAHFFDAGISHFTKRDYAAAEKAFQRSILEDPGSLEYHYWRVVAEIGEGEIDDAYAHVRPLTERRRTVFMSSEYVGVLYSLERVQGPLRNKLRHLEDRAFKDVPLVP